MARTITFKDLSQKTFTVSVEDADSIATVKEKVTALGKPVSKLIYSGKVLDDAKTVGEVDIKEKDFVVVMFAKAKPAPKAAEPAAPAASPAAASTSTPATDAVTPAAVPATEVPAAAAASTDATMSDAAATSEPASFTNQASFVSGEALQSAISNMMEMGFEKDQVMKALRASFNNPDRAVEYLMTGIPGDLGGDDAPPAPAGSADAPSTPPAAAPVATSDASSVPAAPVPAVSAPSSGGQPENLFAAAAAAMNSGRGGGGGGAAAPAAGVGGTGAGIPPDLAAMANNPMFAQLRQMVQQNPALIQPLIQQLAQSNPALAQQLAENPQALYALLGGLGGDGGDDEEWEGADELMGQFGGEGDEGEGGHQNIVSVTEEERGAIERLESMGFDRNRVLEAFLLCDRNEEMAANYLFDTAGDE